MHKAKVNHSHLLIENPSDSFLSSPGTHERGYMEQGTRKSSGNVPVIGMITFRQVVMVADHYASRADYRTSGPLQACGKHGLSFIKQEKGVGKQVA